MMAEPAEDGQLPLKVTYRNEVLELQFPSTAKVADLAVECANRIQAEPEKVSLFFLPKPGFLKHPFPDRKLADILTPSTRIKLVGTPTAEVKSLDETGAKLQARDAARRTIHRNTASKASRTSGRDWQKIRDEANYTFHAIEPLTYLPNPEKSRRFLERLANDPGIKSSMIKHKFSVGLLTEMNPAEHTTHESKTLGLNRNRGEVIELRLRTDAYDGYRDYKVIRKTLCHELSHNVWGDHDRNFWDLTKQIEAEVERNDWTRGGHRLTGEEFYNPADADASAHAGDGDHEQIFDHGGWTGGEFVLGRSRDENNSSSTQSTTGMTSIGRDAEAEEAGLGLTRRDIMARAALKRQEKAKEVDRQQREDEQQRNKGGGSGGGGGGARQV